MLVDLSTVIVEGLFSALPVFGMPGRIYFATDTKRVLYDTGTAWVDVTPGAPAAVALVPGAAGNFQVAHGLGAAPSAVCVLMTSPGSIWAQNPTSFDATYLYLAASDASVTGKAYCTK